MGIGITNRKLIRQRASENIISAQGHVISIRRLERDAGRVEKRPQVELTLVAPDT